VNAKAQHLKNNFSGWRSTTRLPLVVRTAADVRVLRDNSRAVRRLPAGGVIVAVDHLDVDLARTLKASAAAYIRSCGCAEGGVCAIIVLLGVLVLIVFRIATHDIRWSDLGIAGAGFFMAVLAGGLGKLIGLTIARLRFERICDDVIRMTGEN
jgi:hypothetical protein